MTSAWGNSWGSNWADSWRLGTVVPITPVNYVNNSGFVTPRHERLGRPRPDLLDPIFLKPLVATISAGQGRQSVIGKLELTAEFKFIAGVSQAPAFEDIKITMGSVIDNQQSQSSQAGSNMKMGGGLRSGQTSTSSAISKAEMKLIVKSGGEALAIPTYAGEETPDAFFEAPERAA